MLRPLEQLGQPGDVRRDPPSLVAGKQMRGCTPAGLVLEINVGDCLAVVVSDDDARLPELYVRVNRQTRAAGSGGAQAWRPKW